MFLDLGVFRENRKKDKNTNAKFTKNTKFHKVVFSKLCSIACSRHWRYDYYHIEVLCSSLFKFIFKFALHDLKTGLKMLSSLYKSKAETPII